MKINPPPGMKSPKKPGWNKVNERVYRLEKQKQNLLECSRNVKKQSVRKQKTVMYQDLIAHLAVFIYPR